MSAAVGYLVPAMEGLSDEYSGLSIYFLASYKCTKCQGGKKKNHPLFYFGGV